MEIILRIIVGGLIAMVALADMINLIWFDEPLKDTPDNINSDIED